MREVPYKKNQVSQEFTSRVSKCMKQYEEQFGWEASAIYDRRFPGKAKATVLFKFHNNDVAFAVLLEDSPNKDTIYIS